MSNSILEWLQKADYSLHNNITVGILTREQVRNATILLEKGYNIYTQVEPLLSEFGNVESVPHIDDNPNMNQDD